MSIRILLLPALAGLILGAPAPAVEAVRLLRAEVAVREVEYEFALRPDERDVPRLDWDAVRARPPRVVTRKRAAIVLQNAHFRATLFPELGRVHSFVRRPTGREQLWINPAAPPIPAHNDTGFWVTWGGVECVLPRGEHGTSHALEWRFEVEEDSAARKAVRVWNLEPLTGLKHTLELTSPAQSTAIREALQRAELL